MNWITFIFALFLMLALDVSLGAVLKFHALAGIGPRFVPILLVFVALFASRRTALWAAAVGGLLLDLSTPLELATGAPVYVPGPHALGAIAGTFLILQLRPMLFRGRSLTIAFLTAASLIVSGLVVVAFYTVRSWYPDGSTIYPTEPSAMHEYGRQLGAALYSAVVAVPVAWMLIQTGALWGFPNAVSPHRMTRS